mgnify:CR=1 FL=1
MHTKALDSFTSINLRVKKYFIATCLSSSAMTSKSSSFVYSFSMSGGAFGTTAARSEHVLMIRGRVGGERLKAVTIMAPWIATCVRRLKRPACLVEVVEHERAPSVDRDAAAAPAGTSAYSRHIDYARMRQICDKVGAFTMVGMG